MRNDPNKVLRTSASTTLNARDYKMVLADATSGAIALVLISPAGLSEWSIKVANIGSGDDVTLSVAGGGAFSLALPAGAGAIIEQDDLGVLHVFGSTSGSTGGGPIPAGSSITYSATPYAGTGSFQPIGPDLNLAAAAGSSTDSKYIATGMFNILGDALTKTKTYIAAAIAKLSITGTNLSSYPRAAIAAEVGDGVTAADAAVIAVVGGDSAQTNARAAYAVDNQNSTPGSGFSYVIDGYKASHDGYPAFVPLLGFARVGHNTDGDISLFFGQAVDDTAIVAQVGSDALWADGSLYISAVAGAGKLFQKQNDVWVDLQV